MPPDKAILLFDGVCNLCNGSVRFILKRDRREEFLFAALQSTAGQGYLRRFGLPLDGLFSVIMIEGDRYYLKAEAALRVLRRLGWPWKALYVFIAVPRPIRDAVYDLIADHRYRVFGRSDACMVPTPELKARFLE